MKSIAMMATLIFTANVFAYDSGFRKVNCIAVNIAKVNAETEQMILKEIEKLEIPGRRIVENLDKKGNVRIIIMGKNGSLAFDKQNKDKPYFKLNKDLDSLLMNEKINESGHSFQLATVGECLEAFKL